MLTLPTYDDVTAAAARIRDHAHRTPVLTSQLVDAMTGARVFFKAENFQRGGAFKFRGAFNALSQFTAEQRAAGVFAFSSGNHAQAVALSARILGIPATILMPLDAPESKLAATKSYGAQVVTYDRYTQGREQVAAELAARDGRTLIPPFDHPHVIAGQGTAVLELLADVGPLDALFVPLGGGGLLAGSTLAAQAVSPKCKIFGVEPQAGNDGQLSFRTGAIVHIDTPRTIADGAQTQHLGEYTFPIINSHIDDVYTASDAQLVDAMSLFASRMKIVVEPTGCLGFAALCERAGDFSGQRVGVVISGGNIDTARLAQLLAPHGS